METITVVGRLGQDAEMKDAAGSQVCEMSVAVNSRLRGEDVTRWYRVSYWGRAAEGMCQYATKGREVVVSGRFSVSESTSAAGELRYWLRINATDVKLVGRGTGSHAGAADKSKEDEMRGAMRAGACVDDDDDIPF